jgi:hypothetical protein
MIRYCARHADFGQHSHRTMHIAQWCNPNIRETTPSERLVIDIKQSTVLDTKTGLMWERTLDYTAFFISTSYT